MVSSTKQSINAFSSIDNKHPIIATQYKDGVFYEEQVKTWLRDIGHDVSDSTKEENIVDDIDCWVDGEGVSIKSHLPKYFNMSFQFELEGCRNNRWVKSWYYTGKAKYYVMWKRHNEYKGELYRLNKEDVVNYVEDKGWSRIVELNATNRKIQRFGTTTNARLGCIEKKDAINGGVAQLIAASKEPSIERLRQTAEDLTLDLLGLI